MLEVLADGFAPTTVRLDDLRAAVAWTDDATPGVQARVEEAAALFPHVERIDFPQAQGHTRVFMHEVGEVHRALFDEHADEYGEDVAWKLRELCFPVTDAELAEAQRVRASFRDEAEQLLEGFDLLLTPTQGLVAPTYAEAANDAVRIQLTRYTNPFNALGWPALAIPCGPAEDGLPASLQIVGRPGTDALVLAAGLAVETALLTH
jgi:Asp-tRNA(Asn)/Glu-tRNA(Gln) amidotransferase A subunit family amidase